MVRHRVLTLLKESYETGYVGTMYDIHKQGIPVITPIDQTAAVRAILTDSKVSNGLYKRLGIEVAGLKKVITQEISRGIATGLGYGDIARNISNATAAPFSRTKTIARTEGHRIQQTSTADAQQAAKAKGADVVKQWDAALDGKTRPSHRMVDGEIRELDEKFSNGLMYPGDPSGPAAEVINCRCTSDTRARWALDEAELQTLKDRAAFFGLDKTENFEEFKTKYLQAAKEEYIPNADIRNLPNVEYITNVNGLNVTKTTTVVDKLDDPIYSNAVTLASRETATWDSLPNGTRRRIQLRTPEREYKSFSIDKGQYKLQKYVASSDERLKREEIAKAIGGNYLGTSFQTKYKSLWDIDFYQKDGKIIYTIGRADIEKTLTHESLKEIIKTAEDREKIILKQLGEKQIDTAKLKERHGNEWVDAMKQFHHAINADGKPDIISDAEYDAIQTPVLYRGIAPASHLRKDIKTTLTTSQMADGFYTDRLPFPSRGVYGDGVAYCSPSLYKIGAQYASSYGTIQSGGKIIEFKLKEDAKTIDYEDALELFRTVSSKTKSDLVFAKEQKNARDKEIGKAMNTLGYDAIIKQNGDDTGVPFYVILNRGALVAKSDWTTVTVDPEWLRKAKREW